MISRYLDISTGHITKRDNDLLQVITTKDHDDFGFYVYHYDYGYFISVYPDAPKEENVKASGFSSEFFALLNYARQLKINLIRIKLFEW